MPFTATQKARHRYSHILKQGLFIKPRTVVNTRIWTEMVKQSAESQARIRIRKAVQEGRQIDCRTAENQKILEEELQLLQEEGTVQVKRIRDAAYKGGNRIKEATENGVQEVHAAKEEALRTIAAAGQEPAPSPGPEAFFRASASPEAFFQAASPAAREPTLPEVMEHSTVKVEEVTDEAVQAQSTFKRPGFYAAMSKEEWAKVLEIEKEKTKKVAQQCQEEREKNERWEQAKKKARVELLDRLGGVNTCLECEEYDWNLGGACDIHQEQINTIATGLLDVNEGGASSS